MSGYIEHITNTSPGFTYDRQEPRKSISLDEYTQLKHAHYMVGKLSHSAMPLKCFINETLSKMPKLRRKQAR